MMNGSHDGTIRALRAWRIAAVVVVVISAYFVFAAGDLVYSDRTGPGGGFFPTWIGGLGIFVGLALLVTVRERTLRGFVEWTWPGVGPALRIVLTVAAVAFAAIALERLGFRLTLFVFFIVLLLAYKVKPVRAIAISAVGSVALYYLFYNLLKVQLPVGPLGI